LREAPKNRDISSIPKSNKNSGLNSFQLFYNVKAGASNGTIKVVNGGVLHAAYYQKQLKNETQVIKLF